MNTSFKVICLTRLGIKSKFSALEADASYHSSTWAVRSAVISSYSRHKTLNIFNLLVCADPLKAAQYDQNPSPILIFIKTKISLRNDWCGIRTHHGPILPRRGPGYRLFSRHTTQLAWLDQVPVYCPIKRSAKFFWFWNRCILWQKPLPVMKIKIQCNLTDQRHRHGRG